MRSFADQKASPDTASATVQHPFAPRPFAPQVNAEQAPTLPDLQTQIENAQRFGHHLGKNYNLSAPPLPYSPPLIQPKLTIGAPGDKYEQEADRVAQQVVHRLHAPKLERTRPEQAVQREAQPEEEEELQMKPLAGQIQREEMPDEEELQMKPNVLQRENAPEDEEELQMKPLVDQIQREEIPEGDEELQMKPMQMRGHAIGGGEASTDLESAINGARGGGQPLDAGLQRTMGQAMGADFSGVRVHTDAQADQLNRSIQAKAFTTGQDVFFRQGEYNPGSHSGQELIAHELTHVVQQTSEVHASPKVNPTKKLNNQEFTTLVQRVPKKDSNSADALRVASLRPKVEGFSAHALSRHHDVMSFISKGLEAVKTSQNQLLSVCDKYEAAYKEYEKILSQAKEAAQSSDDFQDAIIGVAIGVAMGVGVGEMIALSEGASLAAKAGTELIGELGEWGAGAIAKNAQQSARDATNNALLPGQGDRPELQRLEVWKKLTDLNNKLAKLSLEVESLPGTAHANDLAFAEIKVYASGGKGEISIDELERRINVLEKIDKEQAKISQKLTGAQNHISIFKNSAADAAAKADQHTMEQDIWIRWMGQLTHDVAKRVLDIVVVENHLKEIGLLGKGGRLGVDFGWWTSEADTDDARRKAYWESRKFDLIGRTGLVAQAPNPAWGGAGACLVNFQGQPKLWQVNVIGDSVTVGMEVIAFGSVGQRLQVKPTGSHGNADEARAKKDVELEFEGEVHAAPGHI